MVAATPPTPATLKKSLRDVCIRVPPHSPTIANYLKGSSMSFMIPLSRTIQARHPCRCHVLSRLGQPAPISRATTLPEFVAPPRAASQLNPGVDVEFPGAAHHPLDAWELQSVTYNLQKPWRGRLFRKGRICDA